MSDPQEQPASGIDLSGLPEPMRALVLKQLAKIPAPMRERLLREGSPILERVIAKAREQGLSTRVKGGHAAGQQTSVDGGAGARTAAVARTIGEAGARAAAPPRTIAEIGRAMGAHSGADRSTVVLADRDRVDTVLHGKGHAIERGQTVSDGDHPGRDLWIFVALLVAGGVGWFFFHGA